MKRVFSIVAVAAALFTAAVPLHAGAQSQEPGAIIITVNDALTGKPLDSAQVFLLGGDSPQSSLTNAKGLLVFSNLQPGVYRIAVEADNYKRTELTTVEVNEGQHVAVSVKMAPALRTIAAVTARSSVEVGAQSVGEESAQRKISQSLSDSLNKLAGVIADNELYGADSAFNVSLRNADVSQTMYSIDGIHIGSMGAQIAGGAQDVFSGSSVSFAPSAGGLGGSVNFFTLQPTKTWNYGFTGQIGNYATTSGVWSVTGGSGKVALAMEHAAVGGDAPLNGMTYADQSGSTYEHHGAYARGSNVFKVNLTISPASSLKFASLGGSGRNTYICNSDTTLLPCGNGPGSGFQSKYGWGTLAFESLAGHVQYTLAATRGNFTFSDSEPNRAVNGTVVPFSMESHSPWSSLNAYASVAARRHTISFGSWTSLQNSYVKQTYNGAPTPQAQQGARDFGVFVSDKVKANDKLALEHALSDSAATGAGSALEFYESLTWQPAKSDTYTLSFGVGSAQPAQTNPSSIGDPLTAQYDCYNKSVYVQGPSESAVRQSSQEYDAGWRHSFKGGFLNLNAYRNNFTGQSLYAAVPIGSEPPSLFPGNSVDAYLDEIAQTWSRPGICGSAPFSPDRVFVNQSVTGLSQINQGVTISGQIPLGKHAVLFPTYTTASTYLSTLDPRLSGPGSYYAPGAQLPHRPLHTAGLIYDRVVPRAHVEWLLNAQFTSANNSNNLPAYTVFNGGIVFQGSPGTLTLTVSNIFGTHTGLFTTYQAINPMPLQGGGSFAYATTPLPPRAISLTYRVHWHQHEAPRPAKK